jgi:uncharacterized RDD family membrane protein YckC
MTNEASPWSNQPAAPASGPTSGWTQPGQAPAAPTAGYSPIPGGHPGPATGYAPDPSAYGPPPGYPGAPGYGQPYPPAGYAMPLRTDYTGWGRRVGANLIDSAPSLVGLAIFYVGYFYWLIQLSASTSTATPDFTAGLTPMLVGGAIMLAALGWTVYNRWITAGRTGQSLGKRVTHSRLISETTNAPIGAMNAFLRDLVHIVDGAAYIGYLWPLWDDKRQTFADKIMRTIVVNESRP